MTESGRAEYSYLRTGDNCLWIMLTVCTIMLVSCNSLVSDECLCIRECKANSSSFFFALWFSLCIHHFVFASRARDGFDLTGHTYDI